MEVGRLVPLARRAYGSESEPFPGFAGRCHAAGRVEPGGSGGDAAGVAGAAFALRDAIGRKLTTEDTEITE